jgi:hypothetical protein
MAGGLITCCRNITISDAISASYIDQIQSSEYIIANPAKRNLALCLLKVPLAFVMPINIRSPTENINITWSTIVAVVWTF